MATATLIYDANCPFCCAARDWFVRRAIAGQLEYMPCQAPERIARFPSIPEAQCMEAMQVVMADGTIYSGDRALPALVERLRGWRWLAWVLRVPPIVWASGPIYRFVAKRRYALLTVVGGKHANSCSVDGQCE